jgi:predicted DNA-binding protein (UPF0251 family)
MLCKTCKDRATCTALCNAAEQYVNQDHGTFPGAIYLRDQTVQHPGPVEIYRDENGEFHETGWADMTGQSPALTGQDWRWLVANVKLTLLQYAALNLYYWRRLTLREVAALLGINSTTAKKHIDKAKLKTIEHIWAVVQVKARRGQAVTTGQKTLLSGLLHTKHKFTPFYMRAKPQDNGQGIFQLCL